MSAARYGRSVVIALKASQTADDPRDERDVLARQSVRIAAAVPALVARAHELPTSPSSPPTCTSIRSPSIVWVSMTRPLLGGQRAGLVEDLVRDPHLADVVQKRRELGVEAIAVSQVERVGDRHHELTTSLAVEAGVGVVGLDHVAEQKGRAAVGVGELERVVDPHPRSRAKYASRPDERQPSRNA